MAGYVRKGHWVLPRKNRHRMFVEEALSESTEELEAELHGPGEYGRWLIRMFGRSFERRLIRTRQRYETQKPRRQRMTKVHADYRRRSK